MSFLLIFSALGLLLVCYGWGALLQKVLKTGYAWHLNPALGFCLLVAFGGVLNALTLANYAALYVLAFVGIGVALIDLIQCRNQLSERLRQSNARLWVLSIIVIFLCFFHLGGLPSVLNFHDDLEKYLRYTVQMVQEGSVAQGPFDSAGFTVFGGLSFLQGFALLMGPLEFIAVIDAVVAPMCILGVLCALSKSSGAMPWGFWAGTLLLLFVDPQIVNTSALFSGVLPICLISFLVIERLNSGQSMSVRLCFIIALSYASMLAMKSSLALVVVLHFPVLFGALLLFRGRENQSIWWLLSVPFMTAMIILPWVAVHADKIFSVFLEGNLNQEVLSPLLEEFELSSWKPFSTGFLFYGYFVSNLHYTLTVIFISLSSLFMCFVSRDLGVKILSFVSGILIVVFYLLGMAVMAPNMMGYNAGLRYVLGGLLTFSIITMAIARLRGDGFRRTLLFGSVLTLILISFAPSFMARMWHAANHGHSLGIFRGSHMREFTRASLSDEQAMWMRKVQESIPEEGSVLVWSLYGYHLNFNRNELSFLDPAGLVNPSLDFPYKSSVEEQLDYLREMGVSHIIWQYRGGGVRSRKSLERLATRDFPYRRAFAARTLLMVDFLQTLPRLKSRVEVVYRDNMHAIFRIK